MISTTAFPINVSTDLIRSYYYNEFDQGKKINSGIVIDDSCYELMFVKEENVKISTGNEEVFLLPPSYTLNNLKGPFKFEFSEKFSSFCIKLQPWMNASYVPTKKSQLLNLNELYPKHMGKLHLNLFNSISIEEMVNHAEHYLLSLRIPHKKEVELIKNICILIYERSGHIEVNEIATRFNIYRQKLNALFKQEVKYTLKAFINNVRIRACLDYKFRNPHVSLTEISYYFGYFDQAHFNRSFRNACGIGPKDYVKEPGYTLFSSPIPSLIS